MTFMTIKPPKYDCEIFHQNFINEEEANGSIGFRDQFLVLGLSKGTFLFIDVDNLESIYSRFSVHRQAVNQIYEIVDHVKVASICGELVLNLWGFEGGKSQVYKSFNVFRDIIDIKVCHELLFLGFNSGDTELLYWEEEGKELYKLYTDKLNEHESDLVSIDMHLNKEIFATGGKDGLVKVWNKRKELIREIKFPEPITAVAFLNEEGDLLVGHLGKVSSVLA